MDELLNYEGLVYGIIGRYAKYFEKDDLYQVGMMGLINAYNNYDKDLGVKFSTYAYYYVSGEVKKYIRESNLVKISGDLVKINNSIEKAKEAMSQRLGREPTLTELSLFLEVDSDKIVEAISACSDIKSLDYSFDNDDTDLYNSIINEEKNMNDEILDLKFAINGLSSDEKKLIIDRYFNDMTQSETSRNMGISQVQVSRKEGKILEKLKCQIRA